MDTKIFDYIIPAGVTADADFPILDLGSRSIVALFYPSSLTNTSISFKTTFFNGEFFSVAMGGNPTVFTAVPGALDSLSNAQVKSFRAFQLGIIKTGAGEASDRLIKVVARHVG